MTECVFSEVDVSLCRCFKVVMDYNTLYMCVRERERESEKGSDDGLLVTYLNRPAIRASAVIRGASLRQAEVSGFEDYDMHCNNMDLFPCCYYSFVWNIGALHMEAITRRAGEHFSIERRGAGDYLCIMPRGLFFPEDLCLR